MTKILDCTIRDGGYLNNWEFSDEEVGSLIGCAIKNGVEYFEIGQITNTHGLKGEVRLLSDFEYKKRS